MPYTAQELEAKYGKKKENEQVSEQTSKPAVWTPPAKQPTYTAQKLEEKYGKLPQPEQKRTESSVLLRDMGVRLGLPTNPQSFNTDPKLQAYTDAIKLGIDAGTARADNRFDTQNLDLSSADAARVATQSRMNLGQDQNNYLAQIQKNAMTQEAPMVKETPVPEDLQGINTINKRLSGLLNSASNRPEYQNTPGINLPTLPVGGSYRINEDPFTKYNVNAYSDDEVMRAVNSAKKNTQNPLVNAEVNEGKVSPNVTQPYTFMTTEEKYRYNALFGLYGKEAAEEFHNAILDDINSRVGQYRYEKGLKDTDTLTKGIYSYGAGLRSGVEGLANLADAFTGDTEREASPIYEQTSAAIRSDPENKAYQNVIYDIAQSTGNMTPGMVASAIPGIGPVAGDLVFAMSQAGNAYREAINTGHDVSTARAYALQQGVDEELTNRLLGGIAAFGGGEINNILKSKAGSRIVAALDKISASPAQKEIMKGALDYAMDMGGEAAQEYLQFYTENWTKAFLNMRDENGIPVAANINFLDNDALYSALLGALNAGLLNVAPTAVALHRRTNNPLTAPNIDAESTDTILRALAEEAVNERAEENVLPQEGAIQSSTFPETIASENDIPITPNIPDIAEEAADIVPPAPNDIQAVPNEENIIPDTPYIPVTEENVISITENVPVVEGTPNEQVINDQRTTVTAPVENRTEENTAATSETVSPKATEPNSPNAENVPMQGETDTPKITEDTTPAIEGTAEDPLMNLARETVAEQTVAEQPNAETPVKKETAPAIKETKVTNKTELAAAKRFTKNTDKLYADFGGYIETPDGRYLFTDGAHWIIVRHKNVDGFQASKRNNVETAKTYLGALANGMAQNGAEVTISRTELRDAIKAVKNGGKFIGLSGGAVVTPVNKNIVVSFGKNTFAINAPVLADALELIPDAKISLIGNGVTLKGESGEGLVLGAHLDASYQKAIGSYFDNSGSSNPPAETKNSEPTKKEKAKDSESSDTTREETPAKTEAVSPQRSLADKLVPLIKSKTPFSSNQLFQYANEAFGGTMAEGTYTVKDAYDGMELAVNIAMMEDPVIIEGNGTVDQAKKALKRSLEILDRIPTMTKRTEETDAYQQFSTPPNIAFLAARVANVDESDVVLEPSAGIGGLALFPKAWGAKVYVNELSERRLEFLKEAGFDGVFGYNAEQINNLLPDDIKPSVVIMNPPFSAAATRKKTNDTKNAIRHITQALDRLEDGGRLVAILGRGMADNAPSFKKWWNEMRGEYNVRANVQINGENYKKYGTTFDVQLVVIDKTGPNTTPTLTGTFNNVEDVLNSLEGIRDERTRAGRDDRLSDNNVSGRGTVGDVPPALTGRKLDGAESDGRNPLSDESEGRVRSSDERRRSGSDDKSGRNEKTVSGVSVQTGDQLIGGRGNTGTGSGSDGKAVAEHRLQPDSGSESVSEKRRLNAKENEDSTYSAYIPSKARFKGAKPHPAVLVESAAMGAVEPPDVSYVPHISQEQIEKGFPSDAQLENIAYAGQAHSQMLPDGKTRKGFFIGDGTGVGKGVQIASIILDNYNQGRKKSVWISEKAALINDAKRDLSAVGINEKNAIDFSKYNKKPLTQTEGTVFSTYDTLRSRGESGLKKLKDWLGEDFDGVIVFDEAHAMGNATDQPGTRGKIKASGKALAGVALEDAFPNARVVYASATGATEPSNYAYLNRLGLWGKGTAFKDFRDFVSKISDGGLAAMELVARDMKAMGLYMARSISYSDVTYDTLEHKLTPMQREIYDSMSDAWQVVFQNFQKALEVTGQSKDGNARGRATSAIYGSQQRFYNQILTSMAMPSVVEDIHKELDAGRSVILQLVNTNEASTNRAIAKNAEEGGDLDELDLTPSDMLINLVENSFPIHAYEEYTDDNGNTHSRPVLDANGEMVVDKTALRIRDELLEKLSEMKVPDGPLELLFDEFGVENVAEVTGRTRRVVMKEQPDGSMKRVIENRSSKSGAADTQAFQDGKKRILVFSEAGGTGRSYHADLRAKNQQQRVHYLIQAGWKANAAVQGFGRSHRSNQASAPIFKLVTTDVKGQKRFISTIAKRLDQLGALTKGQRNTGSGMFNSADNLESPVAADALSRYYRELDTDILKKLGLYDALYDSFGKFKDKASELRDVPKFLNRILSLRVDEQNEVFDGFFNLLESMTDAAIAAGTADRGLENLKADKVEVIGEKTIRKDPSGAETKYVELKTYQKPKVIAFKNIKDLHPNFIGLYKLDGEFARAVYELPPKTGSDGRIQKQYKLESPNYGQYNTFGESTFKERTTEIPESQWKSEWEAATKAAPEYIEKNLHFLTGALLPIWDRLPTSGTRVMRVMTENGDAYLGRLIPPSQIDGVLRGLGAMRDRKAYTPAEAYDSVMKGKKVSLSRDRITLEKKRVSGEWRIEITGNNIWYLERQYPGIFKERIQWETRFFVPVGDRGKQIISDIIKDNPVRDITEASSEIQALVAGPGTKDMYTTSRTGDPEKKAMSASEIIAKAAHDFGINITEGHIRLPFRKAEETLGIFNKQDRGIRTRYANDIEAALHEIGHSLDLKYSMTDKVPKAVASDLEKALGARAAGYEEDEYIPEGYAEFFRQYMSNSAEAQNKYPEAAKWFLQKLSAEDFATVSLFANEVNAYLVSAADSASSAIRAKEDARPDFRTKKEKLHDWFSHAYQKIVDSNYSLKELDREAGTSAHLLATNAAYRDAVAGRILESDLTDIDGQYVGPGLSTVLEGINITNPEEYREFGEYLVNIHGQERVAAGKQVYANPIQNDIEWMRNRNKKLDEKYPEFAKAAERLREYERNLYWTWGVGTGLISADTMNKLEETYSSHYPLYRVSEKTGSGLRNKKGYVNQSAPLARAVGSGKDILNPVDGIMEETVQLVDRAIQHNVMMEVRRARLNGTLDATVMERIPDLLVPRKSNASGVMEKALDALLDKNLLDEDILGTLLSIPTEITTFEKGKAHGDIVTIMVNGKPEFWKVNDPELLSTLTQADRKTLPAVLRAIKATTQFVTANLTGNNPLFSIFSNAPRDIGTLAAYSPNKADSNNPAEHLEAAKNVIKTIAKSYVNSYRDSVGDDRIDPLHYEYMAMGGANTSAFSADVNMADKVRKKIFQTKRQRAMSLLNPLEFISFLSDTIERGPREATYILCRQSGMTPQESFYHAMDVTVNFRRGGEVSREVNIFVPFFNAGVQGTDKFARYFSAEDAPSSSRGKVAKRRIGTYLAASVMIGALQYAVTHQDEEDKENYELLSNYTKNNFFTIPLGKEKYFAIPKPREIAVPASLVERVLESISGNKNAFTEFYDYAVDMYLPGGVSDLAQMPYHFMTDGGEGVLEKTYDIAGNLGIAGTIFNIAANRDFLGRPIVSQSLEYYEPWAQYTGSTSKPAVLIGEALGISPMKVDYAFSQTFGWWWKLPKAWFPMSKDYFDPTLGVKNSYVKDPVYSQDIVNWAYDKAEKSSKAKKTYPDDMDKAIEYKMDSNMTTFYSRFNSLNKLKGTQEARELRKAMLSTMIEYREATAEGNYGEVFNAVANVVRSTRDASILPAVLQTQLTKDGATKNFTDKEYFYAQTEYNNLYWEYVGNNLDPNASIGEQTATIKAAKKAALNEITLKYAPEVANEKTTDIDANSLVKFESKIDAANDDGGLTDAEIRGIVIDMIKDGTDFDTAYKLYKSRDSDEKYLDAWIAPGVGGNVYDYLTYKTDLTEIRARNTDTGKRREEVIRYIKKSSKKSSERKLMWEMAGYGASTYSKYMN